MKQYYDYETRLIVEEKRFLPEINNNKKMKKCYYY